MVKKALQFAQALGNDSTDKRLDILRRIGELGSISEAARSAGVSYKGAWQAIDTLGNLAGMPLLERSVGGAGGGGAQLTAAGRELIAAANQLDAAKAGVLAALAKNGADKNLAQAQLGALGLRTSMRNQLPCRVQSLRKVGAMTRVTLVLQDGTTLHSRITAESAELLALAPELAVFALFKATAVAIAASAPKQTADAARNALGGTVTRASRAAGGGEVSLRLDSGLQVVGFSSANAGLKVKDQAFATLDESAVVIALA